MMKLETLLSAGLAVLLVARCGWADSPDGYLAPEFDGATAWLSAVYAIVALIGIMVVAFKNAKRTHLD